MNRRTLLASLIASVSLAAGCGVHNTVDTREEPDYMQDRSTAHSTVDHYLGPKRRVAVIEFDNKTPYGQRELGTAASDIMITELQKTGAFILVERDKVQSLIDEQKFSNSELAEPATAVKLGRMLGASAVVIGSVSQFGEKEQGEDVVIYQRRSQIADATVDVRVVDVASGEILVADSGRGEATQTIKNTLGMGGRASYDTTLAGDAMRAAIFKFVKNVVDRMTTQPFTARVAQVDSGKIYIDAGKATGLAIGTQLEVLRPGKEIISPTTGKSMGETTNHVGWVKVVDYFGDDGAVACPVEGDAQPKDYVKLVAK